MSISKEDLQTALDAIDPKNNNLWTDDGLPRVSAVRALAKDDTITRATINELFPNGFIRPGFEPKPANLPEGAVKVEEPADQAAILKMINADADGDGEPVAAEIDEHLALVPLKTDADVDPLSEAEKGLTDDDVRAIMARRVSDAQEAIDAAQEKIKTGNMDLRQAQERHARCLRDQSKRFPPLTFEANIKQHLQTQQRLREEAAGLKAPIDVATSSRVIANRRSAMGTPATPRFFATA